jgi:alpha-N-acetylglucosaminidase
MSSAYENTVNNGGQESILTGRPSFKENPGGTTNTKAHYEKEDLIKAWQMLVSCSQEFAGSDGYRYDLVDVTRQVLADYASVLQQNAAGMYEAGNVEGFKAASAEFLALIKDMDALLGTRSEFLLGRWLKSARAIGHTQQEKDLYERNARNLITLWGNKDCRIRDYACRQWNGMMGGFYYPRWERFFTFVEAAMVEGVPYDEDKFVSESKDWEWEWLSGHEEYISEPFGSEIEECLKIWNKYSKSILHLDDDFEYEAEVEAYV